MEHGNKRSTIEVIRDDLRGRHHEAIRSTHDGRKDANTNERGKPGWENLDKKQGKRLIRISTFGI